LCRTNAWTQGRALDGSLNLLRQIENTFGNTILHVAARNGCRAMVQALILVVQDGERDERSQSEPPSTEVSSMGEPERMSLEPEADLEAVKLRFLNAQGVDKANNLGWTPLYVAASVGHERIVADLCSAGANPAAADEEGETPAGNSAFMGKLNCLKIMLDSMSEADISSLHAGSTDRASILHKALFALWSKRQLLRTSLGVKAMHEGDVGQVQDVLSAVRLHFPLFAHLLTHLSNEQRRSADDYDDSKDGVVRMMLGSRKCSPGYLLHYFAYMGYVEGIESLLTVSILVCLLMSNSTLFSIILRWSVGRMPKTAQP